MIHLSDFYYKAKEIQNHEIFDQECHLILYVTYLPGLPFLTEEEIFRFLCFISSN